MTAQSRNPAILLTRPAGQSAGFAALLQARLPAATIVISPLLAPRYLNPSLPDRGWAALIFTSQSAVRSEQLLTPPPNLPRLAYCVGDHTAQMAREAGFEPLSASGDSANLAALITRHPPHGPLLYLHGRETTDDLAAALTLAGIEVHSAVTYAQDAQPLSDAAAHLLYEPHPVIVPIFSPRSGALFAAECRHIMATAPLILIAISPAAARTCDIGDIIVAKRPDADAMLDAIAAQMPQAAQP